MTTNARDRIRGGLFGVAIGDALGATVEFLTQDEIRRHFGCHTEITGGGWLNLEPGEVTDDTQMTLAVTRGILANPQSPREAVGKQFLHWFQSKPRDIGNTVRAALSFYLKFRDWDQASYHTHQALGGKTAGNGCLMRTLPVTFAYDRNPEKMNKISRELARMTHYDPLAEATCAFYNNLARQLFHPPENTRDKKRFLEVALQETKKYCSDLPAETLKTLEKAVLEIPSLPKEKLSPTGFCLDTLVCAIWCFLHTLTFEEALVEAVNLGGDADTIGAVCGGLAGTFYGYRSIPARWVNILKPKAEIDKLSQQLYYLASGTTRPR
jgi:ADP-ribosyl-[dinitrogen reductase] hydrolase